MAPEKKIIAPVTLFAAIETRQHDGLRAIAFHERRSLADVVRQALDEFLEHHSAPPINPKHFKVENVVAQRKR